MIGRLILAMLLLCTALPAMAAMPCHDGGGAAMAMAHDTLAKSADHRDGMVAAHICIGCVPPSSWRSAPQPRIVPTPQLAAGWAPAPLVLQDSSRPAIPPPRTA